MQDNEIWKRMEFKMEVIAQPAPIAASLSIGFIRIIGELTLSEST
jgi:hypothetical protein